MCEFITLFLLCMCGMPCQVIESTGVVVTPYMEYPQLLGMLLQMLSEGTPQARTEVLKVTHSPRLAFLLRPAQVALSC